MNRRIAKLIVNAQVASDGGKGIKDIRYICESAYKAGYRRKDSCIWEACNLIASKKNSGFSYYVTDGQITPYLVYFNFKIDGVRKQISFHSYDYRLERFHCTDRVHGTRWDRGDSRRTAVELYELMKGGTEVHENR